MKKILLIFAVMNISAIGGQKPESFLVSWYTDAYETNDDKGFNQDDSITIVPQKVFSVFWYSGQIHRELFVTIKKLYDNCAWITCKMKDTIHNPPIEISSGKYVPFDGSEKRFGFKNPLYGHDADEAEYFHVLVRADIKPT